MATFAAKLQDTGLSWARKAKITPKSDKFRHMLICAHVHAARH